MNYPMLLINLAIENALRNAHNRYWFNEEERYEASKVQDSIIAEVAVFHDQIVDMDTNAANTAWQQYRMSDHADPYGIFSRIMHDIQGILDDCTYNRDNYHQTMRDIRFTARCIRMEPELGYLDALGLYMLYSHSKDDALCILASDQLRKRFPRFYVCIDTSYHYDTEYDV